MDELCLFFFTYHTSHVLTAMIVCFVLIAEHKMVADESVGLGLDTLMLCRVSNFLIRD